MGNDTIKGALDDLKRSIKRVANATRQASSEDTDSNINIVTRKNIVVAGAKGQDGSRHTTSAEQTVHIRQNGREIRTATHVPDPSSAESNTPLSD